MTISRRHFLIGIAPGLILPSFYDKALAFLAHHDRPLLELPPERQIELVAVDHGGGDYELNVGNPYREPPEMTVREYAVRYWGGEEAYVEAWDCEPDEVDWNATQEPWHVLEAWARQDSPNAEAYRLLEDLELGPSLSGPDAVGELIFTDGACPGNDYLGVSAADHLTVSLLQERLNQLDTGVFITMES
jgi:hypothetical protein